MEEYLLAASSVTVSEMAMEECRQEVTWSVGV